jgi:hypothetical protein
MGVYSATDSKRRNLLELCFITLLPVANAIAADKRDKNKPLKKFVKNRNLFKTKLRAKHQ